jgi:hypothetical protein
MSKIRMGFVTNSSSSSFIIALDKLPTSVEDVKKLLFKNGETGYPALYSNEVFSIDEVADRVWQEFKDAKSKGDENVIGAMNGYWDDMPDFYDMYTKGLKFDSKEFREASNKAWKDREAWVGAKYKEFKQTHPGKKIVVLEFSDNDGLLNASIEHGDLFNHLKAKRISHH